MKKTIAAIVAALLLLLCMGCETFTPPVNGPTLPPPPDGSPSGGDVPSTGDGEEGDLYTVTLMCNGESFFPPDEVYAQWRGTDGDVYRAPFNKVGVAECRGLDGEYQVTIDNVPTGFTYDCNGYYADYREPDVVIELLPIIYPTERFTQQMGDGSRISGYRFSGLGTYRAEITSAEDGIWYQFFPDFSGELTVQSWVDVSANEINPKVEVHNGSLAFTNPIPAYSADSGGASSTYTKNFKLTFRVSGDEVGNVLIFHLFADTKGDYPVTVDFTAKKEGEYTRQDIEYEEVYAQGPFLNTRPAGTWRFAYADTGNVCHGELFRLNPADGFYYLYDEATQAYTRMLFVRIDGDVDVIETRSGNGFMDAELDLKANGKDYYNFIGRCKYTNDDPYHDRDENFDLPVDEYYLKYLNTDGAHPVTQEIKDFLQNYADAQSLFDDGNGIAETMGVNSAEADMWLFACGYYV